MKIAEYLPSVESPFEDDESPSLENFGLILLLRWQMFWNPYAQLPTGSEDTSMQSCWNFCLKTLLQQGISEPEFYGDIVYRLEEF